MDDGLVGNLRTVVAVVTAALVVALGIVLAGTWYVSARTAENGCTAEAERRGSTSVSGYTWSWSPMGTTCVFDGGASETRLFW
jgi:hypothetical protein